VGEIIQNDLISLDVNKINFDDKESAKSLIITLLNVVEQLLQENRQLRVEVQQLRDENARSKGEKGKPKIVLNVPPREPQLPPAERSKKWSKDSKKPKIKIDRVVSLMINPETLSPDAVFKGYSSIVIQNIRLQTDNVEYRRENYYSKSLNKNYYAELPKDVQSTQFSSDLKALIAVLYLFEYPDACIGDGHETDLT
jgi:regulator of replication initiation timing